MPTTPRTVRHASGTPPTLAEQARRAQLIAVTIDVIADVGYAGCSLQRIADAAGITKAAVIYHFSSKNAVIEAAYDAVIGALTGYMWTRMAEADNPPAQVEAYVTSLLGYMRANPKHVRIIVEALANDTGIKDRPTTPARWMPLADLIASAKRAGAYRQDVDARLLAIMLGGAIDALVAESLSDPAFELDDATSALLDVLHRAATREQAFDANGNGSAA